MRRSRKAAAMVACVSVGLGLGPAHATPESRAAVLFLLIEPTARAQAMGGAFTAVADDAAALYYNPAGLSQMDYGAFDHGSEDWLPGLAHGLSFSHTGLAISLRKWGTIGIAKTVLDLGEQTRTGERGEVLGTFASKDEAVALSYGVRLFGRRNLG